MRALAFKELREVAGIALAALAGYLVLVVSLVGGRVFDWVPGIPSGTTEVPFVGGGFGFFFGVVSVLFALALGFRQSAWESAQGTYLFLLHRPMGRDRVFLVKLAAGAGLFLLCACVPIVLYAGWASLPGRHPAPFEWSMTAPTWRFMLLVPLLYLGAFLSGLRPGRWLGTRLLPLFGAALLLVVLCVLPLPWPALAALAAAVYAALVGCVCHVARERDYA